MPIRGPGAGAGITVSSYISVEGTVVNHAGVGVAGATVRLYGKATGALINSASTAWNGVFGIADPNLLTPYSLVLVAEHPSMQEIAPGDTFKQYLVISYHVPGDLDDADTDFITVPVPNPTFVQLGKVEVTQPHNTTGAGTVEVRNGADGGGDGITVAITSAANQWSTTAALVPSTGAGFYYIRTGTVAGDLGNCVIRLWLLVPYAQYPLVP